VSNVYVYRPKAVFFRRPSKFENGHPKDGWTVGWLRPCFKGYKTISEEVGSTQFPHTSPQDPDLLKYNYATFSL
jgi:hypothetical protein